MISIFFFYKINLNNIFIFFKHIIKIIAIQELRYEKS